MYYTECILILIIILVLYLTVFNDNRILVEAFNNKKYLLVRGENKKLLKEKADFLANIDNKLTEIVNYMKEKNIPTGKIANLCYNRFKNIKIGEVKQGDSSAAYTLNKNEAIDFCIINEKTGKLNNFNDAIFVGLHELAHVASISIGHGPEFQKIFKTIIILAVKLGIWKDAKYEESTTEFCGTPITNSPCSGGNCNKDNLDYYFKESLLDYK